MLPGKVYIRSAEVAVGCGLSVNGPPQLQSLYYGLRPEVEAPEKLLLYLVVGYYPGALCVDVY